MTITLQDLAEYCSATLQGGDATAMINAAADIINAQPGQVTQLTNGRYRKYLQTSLASACFVAGDFVVPEEIPASLGLLVCADPEMAFIKAVELLHPEQAHPTTIAEQAVVPASAKLGNGIHIGAYAVLGEHCEIGDGTQVLAGAYIGNHVKIGKQCRLHPYCVIYDHTIIGDNVIVHSGAIIGADGFGYKFRNRQHVKVPQVGNVVVGDNVEIGANSCIDRGALGSTTIGLGSKIDNLVQIGHNNQIGKHVIMCGGVGVSGSCHIDDYAILAGSSGIADHVTIGKGAVVMARAGVANDIAAGSHVFGSPAKEKRIAYKEQVALAKLPDLLKKVKWLEEKIAQLEQCG